MPAGTRQGGFSYAEILLSVMLLAVLLVPALQALNTGIAGSAVASKAGQRQFSLRGKIEEVLSKPFGELSAQTHNFGGNTTAINTSLSDPSGSANRRVVVLYRWDEATNALSANDTGLIYISVYFEDEGTAGALNTLVGQWW